MVSTAAMAAEQTHSKANDKSGFAIGIGATKVGGDGGDAIEYWGGNNVHPELDVSYTFSGGFILGGSGSLAQSMSGTQCTAFSCYQFSGEYSTGSLYGGYQLDNGLRLKAGWAGLLLQDDVYDESYLFGGVMVGAGYVFDSGLLIEAKFTPKITNSDSPLEGSLMNATVGYKF